MKVKYLITLAIILFAFGCSHLTISQQQLIAEEIGTDVSYFVLKNNPKYIPKVEVALNVVIEMADEDSVDLQVLIEAVVEYMTELQDDLDLSEYSIFIASKVRLFEGLFLDLDFSIPEEYKAALARCRAFLDGALSGLEMAKGE